MGRIPVLASCLLLASALHAGGQEAKLRNAAEAIPDPQAFVTRHDGTFDGVAVAYTVRTGETYLLDEDGKPKASVFSFAYTRTEIGDSTRRPVMFIWNGGPGSASLWLDMGTFGPRRVVVPSDASNVGAAPYPLVDNPLTLLDVTDLVFVDPVGTGFSRPLGEHEGKEFWGLDEDAASVAEFIERWITDNGRWNSPKFIAGESYGTTRAASVAEILEVERGISLNGIVMDRPCKPSGEVYKEWNWRPDPGDGGRFWEPSYVNVARRLSNALRSNADLRVLVASGFYDMATPFYDAEFTFGRHAILADRIDYTYYKAGHMMYVHGPSLERFMADVWKFVVETCR